MLCLSFNDFLEVVSELINRLVARIYNKVRPVLINSIAAQTETIWKPQVSASVPMV